jgi:hypothetical protein
LNELTRNFRRARVQSNTQVSPRSAGGQRHHIEWMGHRLPVRGDAEHVGSPWRIGPMSGSGRRVGAGRFELLLRSAYLPAAPHRPTVNPIPDREELNRRFECACRSSLPSPLHRPFCCQAACLRTIPGSHWPCITKNVSRWASRGALQNIPTVVWSGRAKRHLEEHHQLRQTDHLQA